MMAVLFFVFIVLYHPFQSFASFRNPQSLIVMSEFGAALITVFTFLWYAGAAFNANSRFAAMNAEVIFERVGFITI